MTKGASQPSFKQNRCSFRQLAFGVKGRMFVSRTCFYVDPPKPCRLHQRSLSRKSLATPVYRFARPSFPNRRNSRTNLPAFRSITPQSQASGLSKSR